MAAEAVARSATERFDLIMMDLNMPAMDGFAATRLIRERERGNGAHAHHRADRARLRRTTATACLAAGMDDLMSKPYTLDQCAQLLRRWMRVARAPGRGAARTARRHRASRSARRARHAPSAAPPVKP